MYVYTYTIYADIYVDSIIQASIQTQNSGALIEDTHKKESHFLETPQPPYIYMYTHIDGERGLAIHIVPTNISAKHCMRQMLKIIVVCGHIWDMRSLCQTLVCEGSVIGRQWEFRCLQAHVWQ